MLEIYPSELSSCIFKEISKILSKFNSFIASPDKKFIADSSSTVDRIPFDPASGY